MTAVGRCFLGQVRDRRRRHVWSNGVNHGITVPTASLSLRHGPGRSRLPLPRIRQPVDRHSATGDVDLWNTGGAVRSVAGSKRPRTDDVHWNSHGLHVGGRQRFGAALSARSGLSSVEIFFGQICLSGSVPLRTRKLSYRKDDRATRHIGALKILESLSTPTATFPEIFNGLLFRSILSICQQNLNFAVLLVPGIIGGTQNFLVPGYAHAPFSPKILMGFYWDGPCECTGQI